MIRSGLLLFLLIACGGSPKYYHTVLEVETRADQVLRAGDQQRQLGRYVTAIGYYNQASDLYLLKGNGGKSIIARLRVVGTYLNQNKLADAKSLLATLEQENRDGQLGRETAIRFGQAQIKYAEKDGTGGRDIIDSILREIDDNPVQEMYYTYFKYMQRPDVDASHLGRAEDLYDVVLDMYQDNELPDIQPFSYATYARAKLALSIGSDASVAQKIKDAEILYRRLEHQRRLADVYTLWIEYYTKRKEQSRVDYYTAQRDRLNRLLKAYLN